MPRNEGNRQAKPELPAIRLAQGISQAELAAELGIHTSTLCGIEKRRGGASPAVQAGIAARLERTVDEFFEPWDSSKQDLAAAKRAEWAAAYADGESAPQIAKREGLSKTTILKGLEAMNVERRLPGPGRTTKAERLERAERAAEGLAAGETIEAIAAKEKKDPGTTSRDLEWIGARQRKRRHKRKERRRLVREERLKGKRNSEIVREHHIGRATVAADARALGFAARPPGPSRFTVRHREKVIAEVVDRYEAGESSCEIASDTDLSGSTVLRMLESEEVARRRRKNEIERVRPQVEAHAASTGRWTQARVEDVELGVSRGMSTWYLDEGYIHIAERRKFGPWWFNFFDPREVKRLARDQYQATSGQAARFRDPEKVYDWALDRGIPVARARELREGSKVRNKRHAKIRVDTGRPPSVGPPDHHFEWTAAYVRLELKLQEQYDSYHVDGDRPPTKLGIALAVAVEDYSQHPERWAYNPDDHPGNAARTVWKAVKPLLGAVTETRAA